MSGCNCGSSCNCGDTCNCGKMYPDLENTSTVTLIEGVAPVKKICEGSEQSVGSEGANTCKCGPNCKCDPCNC